MLEESGLNSVPPGGEELFDADAALIDPADIDNAPLEAEPRSEEELPVATTS